MRFHNRAIDQVQTVARFCRESIENTLPHPSPRPAVEPIVRTRVRAIAFGQIAPRDPGPQHVKYCIYDPSIVRARALPTLRHQRLKNRPFLIAEIESHDPPPPAVNHDPCCFSVNYAGTDPNLKCALDQRDRAIEQLSVQTEIALDNNAERQIAEARQMQLNFENKLVALQLRHQS